MPRKCQVVRSTEIFVAHTPFECGDVFLTHDFRFLSKYTWHIISISNFGMNRSLRHVIIEIIGNIGKIKTNISTGVKATLPSSVFEKEHEKVQLLLEASKVDRKFDSIGHVHF